MAIIGIDLNRENPEYTIEDFVFWMPDFEEYMNTKKGEVMFDNLYPIANDKIFYSIYGKDWKYAMSLCIAHYTALIKENAKGQSGDNLNQIYGGNPKGILTSVSVGGFSKSYDLNYTTLNSDEALFWNQSRYGMALMALYKTKAVPSIFVVTNGSVIPNGNPSFNYNNRTNDPLIPFNKK